MFGLEMTPTTTFWIVAAFVVGPLVELLLFKAACALADVNDPSWPVSLVIVIAVFDGRLLTAWGFYEWFKPRFELEPLYLFLLSMVASGAVFWAVCAVLYKLLLSTSLKKGFFTSSAQAIVDTLIGSLAIGITLFVLSLVQIRNPGAKTGQAPTDSSREAQARARPMILEGIVTTLAADGSAHVAPMGPLVETAPGATDWRRFVLRPFQTAQTYRNLVANPEGVLHVTDDVLLLARAAVGALDPPPPVVPATRIRGWVLADCCRWYEFRIAVRDDSAARARLEADVVRVGRVRDFFGLNRAMHAVVEAAILAMRLALLPRGGGGGVVPTTGGIGGEDRRPAQARGVRVPGGVCAEELNAACGFATQRSRKRRSG